MRFDKLRLLGFKSFVEPTEFVIEKGLTGVVGPNGCGKSNLVEALRWVMGESSHKSMRASGMDDVIFSGSATRTSRNTAEVSLFLDNADRTAPAAFNAEDMLQVTRRIEREAGSAYKINGRDARAKDVQLLFADQSTGARSPSMVGQGRIGELIQAKPQARRALLEEAAGISGLHSRRHEAELRLRGAEQNLERLEDVVAELEAQIESLKRQARQANRFRALSREIREADATLLHLRWMQAKAAEADAQSLLSVATGAVAQAAQGQMETVRLQAIAQSHLPDLRASQAAAAATLQRLTIARDQLDAEASRLAARKREFEERLAQLALDMAREEAMIGENATMIETLVEEAASLAADEEGAGDRETALVAKVEEARAKLEASEADLGALTGERAETAALRTQLERRIRETGERRERLERQHKTTADELAGLAAKIAALVDPAQKQVEIAAADQVLADAERTVAAGDKAVETARAAETALRPDLARAREALNGLEAEARTIAKLLNAGNGGLFAPIMDGLKVSRGYETALGAALGDDLDVAADAGAPVHWTGRGVDGDDPALPDGAEPLLAHVSGGGAIARRLSQIGIVADSQTGRALAPHLKTGQRLVTRDGALWRWDGYVAAADAPTMAAQRLAQKNRLAELDAEIVAAAKLRQTAEAALASAEAETRTATTSVASARETVRQRQADARRAREELAAAERSAGELTRKRAVLGEGAVRLLADITEAGGILAEAQAALFAEPDLAGIDQRLQQAQAIVATDRGRLAEVRAEHQGLARERHARKQRLEAIAREKANWAARAESGKAQIATLAQRRDQTAAALTQIANGPREIDDKRRALVREIETAEKARSQTADRLAIAENDAAAADKAAHLALTTLGETREARARAEERLTAMQERRADIETRIREALNCAPHEAFAATGLSETGFAANDEMPDIEQMERKIDRLRIERERLGAVNLRAEEEQQELVERLDTLVRDRDDVVAAIAELRSAISSLNREGRERLIVAFDAVQGHFTRLFTHLFGGGTAELQMIESDDPLEAGLEIVARPPGKKPQTMTLLSGGEQALTAMALIFAVFLTNPAPICVLDEVDAPLDDHNVERFCDLMDQMARETSTRFVIITHNPITMARMDRLFGVTMAEQGVSQLVSVDLSQAEELREAS